MLSQSEQKAMVERQALLYIGYIVEGIEGDYLRQLIHNQIIHYCVKFDLNDEVDELLHNLDRLGFNSDKIIECKYRQALKKYYADLLAKELIRMINNATNSTP